MWSATPHATLPNPSGAIIKNDRNLFLGTKQAEATGMSSQKENFFITKPLEPQENLFFFFSPKFRPSPVNWI
jgi:hypothetical protein